MGKSFLGRYFSIWECFWEAGFDKNAEKRCAMRKKGYKGRCEKRQLAKCPEVCRTYDEIQNVYADVLQANENISEIRCNVLLCLL